MRRGVVLGSIAAAACAICAASARAESPAPAASSTVADARATRRGWTALQTQSGPRGAPSEPSRLTYARHRLRIEGPGHVAILELDSGAVTYVDRATKSWARVTLEELVQMRDAQLAKLAARIDELPDGVRESFRAQLKAQMEADQQVPRLRATGDVDEVSGYACRVFRWTGPDGDGDVCIAAELPVDLEAFRADVEQLRARMEALGASRTVGAMDFLRLGDRGFPIRTRQKIRLDDRTIDVTSTFSDFRPAEDASLEPPDDYEQVSHAELTRRVGGAP